MKQLLLPVRPSIQRVAVVGVTTPAVAVALARVLGPHNLAAATALGLLAVVVASAIAGRRSGFIASVLTFFGLNFFFTEPRHTFVVHEPSDLVALFVFLIASLIVGSLLSHALEQRDRAERRATEAQLLSDTTAKLISGEPFDILLSDLASALIGLFGLARCEITTEAGFGEATAADVTQARGPEVTIPLATDLGTVGSLTAVRRASDQLFSSEEISILDSLASQTALAVQSAVLADEVRNVRLEAETSALRAALFSSVTHDLRTPLASIKASATGLITEGAEYTTAQRDEMARTVIEEADHLNHIVGNLMDLARMRAGALVPNTHPVFLEDVIASALRRMNRTLEDFEIRTTIRPQLPSIDADPVQLEQLITNVLENAARFSPKGHEIHIAISEWQGGVQARISDQGPGIPTDDRDRVFEEFFSQDGGQGRAGTGLGLAIARAIITAHGGKIWAEEAPAGGTSIVFELPAGVVVEPETVMSGFEGK